MEKAMQGRMLLVDESSQANIFVSYAHAAVHRDLAIRATSPTFVAGTTPVLFLFTTPPNIEVHLSWVVSNQVRVNPDFYESPTVTGAGTDMVYARLNRNSTRPILSTATHGGTVSAKGTLLSQNMLFSTQPNLKGAREVNEDSEWVLKPETVYLLEVVRPTSGILAVTFEWYEVPFKG
jgi:hypothetical protein